MGGFAEEPGKSTVRRTPQRSNQRRGNPVRWYSVEKRTLAGFDSQRIGSHGGRLVHYYSEWDPFAAQWLRNLIAAGHLPDGKVDERDIRELQAKDLEGFSQVHLFAGLGGWPLALRLAGWPDDEPCWTGSVPCQSYSLAGRMRGTDDQRDLWPKMFRLIGERAPSVCFGEQVQGSIAHGWLDRVFAQLESLDYACGAMVLPACAVAAPHERSRVFWVAESEFGAGSFEFDWVDGVGPLADPEHDAGWSDEPQRETEGRTAHQRTSPWSDYSLFRCEDGKARRIESGTQPLAYGLSPAMVRLFPAIRSVVAGARENRSGRLRAYGNSIVPQLTALFIQAYMESQR